MKITKDMTEGNIYKNFLLYALPLIISTFLSQAYSTIDAMIAGKFISEHALGAISATGSYELMFQALFDGFTAGFSIYIAQKFGKKDFGAIKRDSVNMGMFVLIVSVIISVLSIAFRNPIMDYLKVDPILRSDAQTYFVIYASGYFLIYINLFLVKVLYALGITSFALYVSFISALLKICGNLLSVLVFDWGIAGLAFFSVLSSAAATVCYLIMLRRAFKELGNEKISYRFSFSCVLNSLRYTLPAAIQQVSFHGVGLVIAPSINGLGAAATTGYNVSNRIYTLGTQSLWGVTSAFTCYTAQCVGKGDYAKIKRGLKVSFIMNCIMMLPFVLAIMVFAKPISSIFFPSGFVGDAYTYAVRYAMIYLPFVYVQLVGHILHAYMRSLGSMNMVLGITIFGSVIRIIATILLVRTMHIEGAYLGQIISWAADAILSTAIVICGYRTIEQIKRVAERIKIKKA